MGKKKIVVALGHRALGATLPEQKEATRRTAKVIADLAEAGADIVISHSNAPQEMCIRDRYIVSGLPGNVNPYFTVF